MKTEIGPKLDANNVTYAVPDALGSHRPARSEHLHTTELRGLVGTRVVSLGAGRQTVFVADYEGIQSFLRI